MHASEPRMDLDIFQHCRRLFIQGKRRRIDIYVDPGRKRENCLHGSRIDGLIARDERRKGRAEDAGSLFCLFKQNYRGKRLPDAETGVAGRDNRRNIQILPDYLRVGGPGFRRGEGKVINFLLKRFALCEGFLMDGLEARENGGVAQGRGREIEFGLVRRLPPERKSRPVRTARYEQRGIAPLALKGIYIIRHQQKEPRIPFHAFNLAVFTELR
jgi:hypothetical protein